MKKNTPSKQVARNIGHPEPVVEPDFSGLDTAADIIRDAAKMGLLAELRALLCKDCSIEKADAQQTARDIAYELAGAKDRHLAVDVFIRATGIAEFGPASLRDYATRHGVCHEWFRQEVLAMQKRLNLRVNALIPFRPPGPTIHPDLDHAA
ncbi:MAG: hypothetical protein HYV95_03685 [Opitutae bacterium]|nr:hypothetical protein [Opitutae bacterium]